MRIALINMMHVGSTGKIMLGIAESASSQGHEAYTFSPYYYQKGQKPNMSPISNHLYFGSLKENMIHHGFAEISGLYGFGSCIGTKQLIKRLKEIRPDILHLHNLHNFTINLPMLFSYIKNEGINTVWTFHDCWPVTGKCPYFDIAGCDKWKTGCFHCPALHDYPKAYTDRVKLMWKLKQKWFTGIDRMTLVTPSKWLADIVKESFLSDYPVKVIHNGIDLKVFKPSFDLAVYTRYNIPEGKSILLGVAFDWDKRKGLDVFMDIARELPDRYQIVLVGTNESIDKMLPDNIITIHRTQDQKELAALYSIADVLVNPTREDNFPTVNIEALACGTPVITFRTGGSPECLDDTCGTSVACNDTMNMLNGIRRICDTQPFSPEACVARASMFDQSTKFAEYVQLYEQICQ